VAVPTAAMKAGDFSALLVPGNPWVPTTLQLVNPFTGKAIPNNNIAAAGLMDPTGIGQKIAALYPNPNIANPTGTVNYVNNPILRNNSDQYSIRIDHNFTSKDLVYGRYTINNIHSLDPFNAPAYPTIFSGYGQERFSRTQNFVLSYSRLLGNNAINKLRLGYTRYANALPLEHNNINNRVQLGIPGLDPRAADPLFSGTPNITVSGFGGIGYSTSIPQKRWDNIYQVTDNLSWRRGSHAFKFGLNLSSQQLYEA
jgi:hypothetical protein